MEKQLKNQKAARNNLESEKDDVIRQEITSGYQKYYRLAYSYVHNEEDALDIVQEGAYKAILYSSRLKDMEAVKTWVYRIMVNEALRFIQKNRKTLQETKDLDMEEGKEDTYPNQDLRNALHNLGEPDRTIVILRYFEDLKIEDIAYILKRNVSTIKSRLYRAMAKLRKSLEEA